MKKATKALVLCLCAVLLVAVSVMGTLAYLTSTDSVTNTFTVGNVKITLDEAEVTPDGTKTENTERVKANTYKLIPGHKYTKDPTVHVDAASEDSWLFVKVTNEIEGIEGGTTVASQMTEKGWTAVSGENNVYAYREIVNANDNVVVFETFEISGEVTNTDLANYANKTIVVEAYAIQADGFNTAAVAWEAAGNSFNNANAGE